MIKIIVLQSKLLWNKFFFKKKKLSFLADNKFIISTNEQSHFIINKTNNISSMILDIWPLITCMLFFLSISPKFSRHIYTSRLDFSLILCPNIALKQHLFVRNDTINIVPFNRFQLIKNTQKPVDSIYKLTKNNHCNLLISPISIWTECQVMRLI